MALSSGRISRLPHVNYEQKFTIKICCRCFVFSFFTFQYILDEIFINKILTKTKWGCQFPEHYVRSPVLRIHKLELTDTGWILLTGVDGVVPFLSIPTWRLHQLPSLTLHVNITFSTVLIIPIFYTCTASYTVVSGGQHYNGPGRTW